MSTSIPRRCKVRKGLEAPLLVFGMRVSAFYRFLFLLAGYGFCSIGSIVMAINGQIRFGSAVAFIGLGGVIVLLTMLVSRRAARRKRYPPRNTVRGIANHDLLKFLK